MQLYKTIFRQSWEITKRHRVLWLFGFFLLFWSGKGLDIELFFTEVHHFGARLSPLRPEFWQASYWQTLFSTMADSTATGVGVLLLLLAIACFVLFVIMSSQIALVDAFAVFRGKDSGSRYSLDHALQASGRHMLTVLGINVAGKAVSYGLLAIASSPLFFANIAASKFIYTVFLYVLLMPAVVFVSILTKYAVNAAIIEELPLTKAYKRSWEVLSQNIGVSLEFAVLAFLVFLAVNVFAVTVAALATIPFFFLGMLIAFTISSIAGLYTHLYFFYVLAVFAVVFTAAVFSAWHFGNWTLLFLELTKGSRRSKIHRLFVGETPTK